MKLKHTKDISDHGLRDSRPTNCRQETFLIWVKEGQKKKKQRPFFFDVMAKDGPIPTGRKVLWLDKNRF